MPDTSLEDPALATPFIQDLVARRWLAAAALLALGMIAGGYLLGNGLVRAKDADRSETVRGLAVHDATADIAIWTIAYSATAEDLATAQAVPTGIRARPAASFASAVFLPKRCSRSGSTSRRCRTTASPGSPCASA